MPGVFSVARRAGESVPPAERLLALWVGLGDARADPARRRQRAAVRLLHPGARGARPPRRSGEIARLVPEAVATHPAPTALLALPLVLLRALRHGRRIDSPGCVPDEARSRRPHSAPAVAAAAARSPSTPPGRGCHVLSARSSVERRRPHCSSPRWSPPGNSLQFVQWACGPHLQELRGVARARPGAAAGHAGPRQAGQRPGARERASGRSSSDGASATTRTGRRATMCDIF